MICVNWMLVVVLMVLVLVVCLLASAATALALPSKNLQVYHSPKTPGEILTDLGRQCDDLGIDKFDVYGDYHLDKSSSFLRAFESDLAEEFGKDDAVFMPSGVMAQAIALLIHGDASANSGERKNKFCCHYSSHLLLHEEDAYARLLNTDPVVVDTRNDVAVNGYSVPPMRFSDVEKALRNNAADVSTLMLELPHRELGGKCTPWEDICRMREYCNDEGIKFHCDGARIFEATTGYDEKSPAELAEPFDSVYISFYKGLGGISGAALLGDADFCAEARKWLRRFGGNLFTLLPYIVSSMDGFKRNWVNIKENMSFIEKTSKLQHIVGMIQTELQEESHHTAVSFDPEVPEVNMVHGYFQFPLETVHAALEKVEEQTGIRVLVRVREIPEGNPALEDGYLSMFEWTMGSANGAIDDEHFRSGWRALIAELSSTEGNK